MDEEIKNSEWIKPFSYTIKPLREALVDKEVSEIVRKEVKVNDSRLVKLVCEWRNKKNPNQPDEFLKDPNKIRELREVFK